MIQRIQTLWLFLAATTSVLIWLLPVFEDDSGNLFFNVDTSLFLILTVTLSCLLSFATILFYKKRSTQKQLIVLNFCVTIAIVLIEYFEVSNFKVKMGILQGHWLPSSRFLSLLF